MLTKFIQLTKISYSRCRLLYIPVSHTGPLLTRSNQLHVSSLYPHFSISSYQCRSNIPLNITNHHSAESTKYRLKSSNAKSADISSNIKQTRISRLLQLREVLPNDGSNKTLGAKPKPLVLLFPFLYASAKAVDAYSRLYHAYGFDVLTINADVQHFLMPTKGKVAAREVLSFLEGNQMALNTDRYIVHAMSVGAYLYTLVLMEIIAKTPKHEGARRKIIGQIFDSLTVGDRSRMAAGVSLLTERQWLSSMMKRMVMLYFNVSSRLGGSTVKLYDESIAAFKAAPVSGPVLFFYSLDDPMSDPHSMDELIALWRQDSRMDVSISSWHRSVHGAHLRTHPEQYRKALHGFLTKVGLVENDALITHK